MKPVLPICSLLLCVLVQNPVFSQAPGATPIFQFDAGKLPAGELPPEALKEASDSQLFGAVQSQGVFSLKSQNPTISANVVELSKTAKALQIKVPPVPTGQQALPTTFLFSGSDLREHIDPAKPLFLEVTLQQGEVPVRVVLGAGFRTPGWIAVSLAAVLEPDGPYRVFKTGPLSTHDSEIGSPLPSGPVTLKFEIVPEADGMTVNSSVFAQGSSIFEIQTHPQWLARAKLDDFNEFNITVSSFPDELREGSINLISFKAWQ